MTINTKIINHLFDNLTEIMLTIYNDFMRV